MKKTLGMVFFLTVLAGTAGCGQKNAVNTQSKQILRQRKP